MLDLSSDRPAKALPDELVSGILIVAIVIQAALLLLSFSTTQVPLLSEGFVRIFYATSLFTLALLLFTRWNERRLTALEKEKQARQSEDIWSLFSGVRHRLNNDMQIVMGNAELAQILIDSNGDIEKPLENISLATSDAIERIEQLAVFTTSGRGYLKPVDLNAMLREKTARLVSEIPAIVSLQLELGTLTSRVMADLYLLALGLSHLLRESSKMMRNGGELVVKTCDFSTNELEEPTIMRLEIYINFALHQATQNGASSVSDRFEKTRWKSVISLTQALAERSGASNVVVSGTKEQSVVSMNFRSEKSRAPDTRYSALQTH